MSIHKNYDVPILFIAFNRPEPTKIVFDKIKQIRPKKLFISADGPRNNCADDNYKCEEVKKIVKQVNWECEKHYLFQSQNLGCRLNMIQSISWFFDSVEEGIILEDDCLPNNTFFVYCRGMIERYRESKKVFQINGVNWLENYTMKNDFFFTKYPAIWGWATWKDRWSKYVKNISFKELQGLEKKMNNLFSSSHEIDYHMKSFKLSLEIDTWDYNWKYTIFKNQGFCVAPKKNLISNLGFNVEATHTKNTNSWCSSLKTHEFKMNINHNIKLKYNKQYDKQVALKFGFRKRSIMMRLFKKIKSIVTNN